MSRENVELVRRIYDVINRSESVDEVTSELRELLHPEFEFVNPPDAVETGTRRGFDGLTAVLESYFAGVGTAAVFETEQMLDREDMVFVRGLIHARGTASGIEVDGPRVAMIYTIRDNRIYRVQWQWNPDEALARFERGAEA
jgi:ketosteroid isomerase-like protein